MKKIITTLVITFVLALMSTIEVNAANTVSYDTVGLGASATPIGTAVQLNTPDGAAGYAYIRLQIPGGIALGTITTLSYTAQVTTPDVGGYGPEVVLNIDADNNGVLYGTGIDWMFSGHSAPSIGADNFLSGDSFATFGSPDSGLVNRNALGNYMYWSANDARDGLSLSLYSLWTTLPLPVHGIEVTDKVYSIDFVVGTSGNFNGLTALFSSVELNGVTYPVIKPIATKADVLIDSGVPGKGLDTAPGLQKPFNPNSRATEHAGKKK